MLLRIRGQANNIAEPIVGKVTRDPSVKEEDSILITDSDLVEFNNQHFKGLLTTSPNVNIDFPTVSGLLSLDHLEEGDLVSIDISGQVNTLYRVNSNQNFLLATERCNSNCLMCSQPPKDRNDIPYLMHIYRKLIPKIPKDCIELGITGGEPTLMSQDFFELLELIKCELPNTELHCLTNGRSFAWRNFTKRLAALDLQQLMLGIPVYSDYYQVHDYIVQAHNAFDQTILGLHNLALYNQRIEIRIVLHRLSIPRLTRLAKYIYKNLPFVEHITFMGLEHTGYTPHNIDKLWIDPVDYAAQLGEAIEFLDSHKLNVSIYNHQLCTLPQSLWKFTKKSISDWKNIYLAECEGCAAKNMCGGFFASCVNAHSQHIKPIEQIQLQNTSLTV